MSMWRSVRRKACGHGAPHTFHALRDRAETRQKRRSCMEQIDLKDYPERFALCGLPVVKVGINFSTEKRTIEGGRSIENAKGGSRYMKEPQL